MPARRLLMRKIREVLRLKHERGLSHRAIAQACAIGVGTVTLYLKRTAQQGFGWPLPAELDDAALDARCSRSPKSVFTFAEIPRWRACSPGGRPAPGDSRGTATRWCARPRGRTRPT